MKRILQGRWLLAAVAVLSITAIGGVVSAEPNTHAETATGHTAARPSVAEKQAAAQTRLADTRLRVCQNREKTITNIMTRISDRGTKQLAVFNTIADRAETFYTSKGKTLADYDTLVANISTAKAAAEAAVSSISSQSTTFSCDANDPKGTITTFKDSLKSEISALQAYKTSIKNLIVGVKSVESTTATTSSTHTTTAEGAKQ